MDLLYSRDEKINIVKPVSRKSPGLQIIMTINQLPRNKTELFPESFQKDFVIATNKTIQDENMIEMSGLLNDITI